MGAKIEEGAARRSRNGRNRQPGDARVAPGHRAAKRGESQDPRWGEFVDAATSAFGDCDDAGVWETLRRQFDAGLVGPGLMSILDQVRAEACFPPEPTQRPKACGFDPEDMPRDLRELAGRTAEFDGRILRYLSERGHELSNADRSVQHDAARAIVDFIDVLRWAKTQPDEVEALIRGVDVEPGFQSSAAWPRLAYLDARHSPSALEPYLVDCGILAERAHRELRGRPDIVPRRVYDMLDLTGDDLIDTNRTEFIRRAMRVVLEMFASKVADVLFVSGREPSSPGAAAPAARQSGARFRPSPKGDADHV